ncbi:MAG: hypothetical protein AAFX03_11880 [Pseudomonadota bacterium]
MTDRILHVLKRVAVSAVVTALPQRPQRKDAALSPEPVRRPFDGADADCDAWMFESRSEGLAHRIDMLRDEMNRLSGLLGGLREALSDVAAAAPVKAVADMPVLQVHCPVDGFLFDGAEGDVVWSEGDVFVGGDDFLFEDAPAHIPPAIQGSSDFLRFAAAA